jgi:hypothetical protein
MEVLYSHCAGLDVHKKTVVACRLGLDTQGHKAKAIETFGTTTAELLRLSDWLTAGECTHVAMESTGEFWPIWNLEGNFELLVNASTSSVCLGARRMSKTRSGWPTCCNMGC